MKRVDYPEEIRELVANLRSLPGIGPKSAERIAIWLLKARGGFAEELANGISSANARVRFCSRCGFFESVKIGCVICNDTERSTKTICVIEQPTDILSIERTGAFKGLYHSLGGKISPLDNIGPDDLRIDVLVQRIHDKQASEIILAVGSDVEGEATAGYLVDLLRGIPFDTSLTVTRLAQGLPAGAGVR